jgi:hypothetical protein
LQLTAAFVVQPRDKPHPDQVEIAIYNRGVDEPETTTSDPITARGMPGCLDNLCPFEKEKP